MNPQAKRRRMREWRDAIRRGPIGVSRSVATSRESDTGRVSQKGPDGAGPSIVRPGALEGSRLRSCTRRRSAGKARTWLILLSAVGLAAAMGVPSGRAYLDRHAVESVRKAADSPGAGRTVGLFFAAHRQSLAEGLIDLGTQSRALLESNLRLLRRILVDDRLLEMSVHRSRSPDTGLRGHYSAHDWLASEQSLPTRRALLKLASKGAGGPRGEAIDALAAIAVKVPEAFAPEPLEGVRREDIRALVALGGGIRLGGAIALQSAPQTGPTGFAPRLILREVLGAGGRLRLWSQGKAALPEETLGIALRALDRLDDTVIDGDLAAALLSTPDAQGADRVLQVRALGRARHPDAWKRLLECAAGSEGESSDDDAASAAALEALGDSAPLAAVPGLREAIENSQDEEISEAARAALRRVVGEAVKDWRQWKPVEGRLPALAGAAGTQSGEETERGLVAALRFHAVHPSSALRDSSTRRSIQRALGHAAAQVRREAARAIGEAGITEAIGPGEFRPSEIRPVGASKPAAALIEAIQDADAGVAAAAAAALWKLTAHWPAEDAPCARSFTAAAGSLSIETEASAPRRAAWIKAWEPWWQSHRRQGQADWYLEAIESGDGARVDQGARGLAVLVRLGAVPAGWFSEKEKRLDAALLRAPTEARADIIAILGERARPECLWGIVDGAGRGGFLIAREALGTIHRLLDRSIARTPVNGDVAIDGFLAALASRKGPPAAHIVRYLDGTFDARRIDGRLRAQIERPGSLQAATDAEKRRAALLPWFPRRANSSHVQFLVKLLEDPDDTVGGAAYARLKTLAGKDLGIPAGPERDEAIRRWKRWAEGWASPDDRP